MPTLFVNRLMCLLLLLPTSVLAAEVPNPLNLQQALDLGRAQNLVIQQQQLAVENSLRKLNNAKANFDMQSTLDVQLARRDYYDDNVDDSYAFINLEKTLFEESANLTIDSAKQTTTHIKTKLAYLKKQQDIAIMRHFFDVILSDMQLETTVEQLAISAIRANDAQEDFDIKKASELELLGKQAITQFDASKRIQFEAEQILKRAQLADILGIGYKNRPDDLIKPDIRHYFEKSIASIDALRQKAFKNNSDLQTLIQTQALLKKQIQQLEESHDIIISSHARIGEQTHLHDKEGQLRFGVSLSIPIGSNDEKQRNIDALVIKSKQLLLQIKQFKQALFTQVMQLWTQLQTGKQVQKSLTTKLDYSDLYLERARARYEMRLESDLGNALTQFTEVEYQLAKNEFDFAIAFETLALLTGELQ